MEASEAGRYWEGNAETWTRHVRAGRDVYRDALNSPAFLAMLPPIEGLQGLDIGCGEGANTRAVARLGARMQGIDIAPTFIRHAQSAEEAEPLGIAYRVADAAALPFEAGAFDFATAFMSLMDMPDPGRALAEARRVLKPGGFLQFSILHPCFMPPHRKVLRDAKGDAWAVEVGGYFGAVDGAVQQWHFETLSTEEKASSRPFQTPRFHRTLSQWVDALGQAGLAIERLVEPCASPELAAAEPIVADTRIVPLALIVRARPSACLDPPDPRP
jgi:ubiquinone/menaquinone biosynthesis C-methylase UbiE